MIVPKSWYCFGFVLALGIALGFGIGQWLIGSRVTLGDPEIRSDIVQLSNFELGQYYFNHGDHVYVSASA